MSKVLLVLLMFMSVLPSWGVCTMVQHPTRTCSGATCTLTLTQTMGIGHPAIVGFQVTQSGTFTISTISNGGGTYTHCSNCHATDSNNNQTDLSYLLATTVADTVVQITPSSAPAGTWIVSLAEYNCPGLTAIFDTSNNIVDTTCTTCTMPSLSLTGKDDIIYYMEASQNAMSCPGAPWTNPCDLSTAGVVGAVDQSSGLSTLAQSPTGTASIGGLAIKFSSGGRGSIKF